MEGYINAGSYTVVDFAKKYMGNEYAEKLILTFSPNMLISFGAATNTKSKLPDKNRYLKTILNYISVVNEVKGTHLMMDSGGFQFITGRIKFEDLDTFIDYYVDFLNNHTDQFEEAFMLDLPGIMPGGEETIWKLNHKSLTRITSEVKRLDKVIFITQFRDLIFYNVWKKLIYDDNFMIKFKRFSTAGLDPVSKLSKLPVNNYVIGVSMILSRLLLDNVKGDYRFHMLGNSTPLYLLLFYLTMNLIKKVHGINFTVSYDSSSSVRKANLGRQCNIFDEVNKVMYEADFKFKTMNKRNHYRKDKTNQETIFDEIYHMADVIGFDRSLIEKDLYQYDMGPFYPLVRTFVSLLDGYNTIKVERYIKSIMDDIVDDFLNGYDVTEYLADIIYKFKGNVNLKDSNKFAINYVNSMRFIADNPTIEKTDKIINSYGSLLDTERDNESIMKW